MRSRSTCSTRRPFHEGKPFDPFEMTRACVAFYESLLRLIHPEAVSHLCALAAAGVVGFIGNEIAAVIRLRAGSRLDSPYVSLGVVASAALVALGAEVADPLIGLAIGRHPAHCVAVLADDQTRHTRSLSPPCARSFSQPLVPAGLERRPSGDTPGPLSTDRNERRRSTR